MTSEGGSIPISTFFLFGLLWYGLPIMDGMSCITKAFRNGLEEARGSPRLLQSGRSALHCEVYEKMIDSGAINQSIWIYLKRGFYTYFVTHHKIWGWYRGSGELYY